MGCQQQTNSVTPRLRVAMYTACLQSTGPFTACQCAMSQTTLVYQRTWLSSSPDVLYKSLPRQPAIELHRITFLATTVSELLGTQQTVCRPRKATNVYAKMRRVCGSAALTSANSLAPS